MCQNYTLNAWLYYVTVFRTSSHIILYDFVKDFRGYIFCSTSLLQPWLPHVYRCCRRVSNYVYISKYINSTVLGVHSTIYSKKLRWRAKGLFLEQLYVFKGELLLTIIYWSSQSLVRSKWPLSTLRSY